MLTAKKKRVSQATPLFDSRVNYGVFYANYGFLRLAFSF
jgi:hypothetical protein